MTPGINAVRKANMAHSIHEYDHDPSTESYGTEAAEKMAVDSARVFKTLVVAIDGKELAVNILHPALDVRIMEAALDGDAAKERLKCSPSWASNRARYGRSSARRDGSRSGRSGCSCIPRQ